MAKSEYKIGDWLIEVGDAVKLGFHSKIDGISKNKYYMVQKIRHSIITLRNDYGVLTEYDPTLFEPIGVLGTTPEFFMETVGLDKIFGTCKAYLEDPKGYIEKLDERINKIWPEDEQKTTTFEGYVMDEESCDVNSPVVFTVFKLKLPNLGPCKKWKITMEELPND